MTTLHRIVTSMCHHNTETNDITSEPYQLSFCDVEYQANVTVYRGQPFKLHVAALGQGKSKVPTTVAAVINYSARLKFKQHSQNIYRRCSEITYNLYSDEDYEELSIFSNK